MYRTVPKAACTTIRFALAAVDAIKAGEWAMPSGGVGTAEAVRLIDLRRPLQQIPREEAAAMADGFTRFTIVRHPTGRLVSGWWQRIFFYGKDPVPVHESAFAKWYQPLGLKRGMAFDDFVEALAEIPDAALDGHLRSQTGLLHLGSNAFDRIGRVENLAADLVPLIGEEYAALAAIRLNRAPRPRLEASKRTLRLIGERFGKDFAEFGYDPAQIPAVVTLRR